MKKNIILAISIATVTTLASVYFYMANKKAQQKLIPTQPLTITSLRELLELKGVNVSAACANPTALTSDLIDFTDSDLKKRFTYLCDDQKMSKELEENFSTNSDYKYFLNCAKTHAATMQQITNDLKNHYHEDYKNLNFNKNDKENILNKYLKHPKTAYLMSQCESKAEALYWRTIISSKKVEDLKFCLEITQDCISGKTKAEECPANFKAHYDECNKKLDELKN